MARNEWCATGIGFGVNDLDVNVGGMVSKAVDRTKFGDSEEGCLRLLQDCYQ